MSYALYGLAFVFLLMSVIKDRRKTVKALKKAWKAFENILPQLIAIMFLIGILLVFFDEKFISSFIGEDSGILGVIFSSIVGAITLIPSFVAFPTADILMDNGAGIMQTAAFISSLMMVGIVTIPVEKEYFGMKLTIRRNVVAFIFSIIVAVIMGAIL